ncbi:MAG: 2-oxoisovalerate dehydrogenase [Melioribacteraceae bacterium]|nr:2-oxoisovalerate dehydrogenase [Melioribacteraceae bacterium]
MNEIIFMIKDSIDGGFEAQAVGYSIFTEAETMEEIKNNIVEEVDCHFDEGEKPKLIRLHYVKEEIIDA